MAYGAGVIAAQTYGAAHIVDPRPYAVEAAAAFVQHTGKRAVITSVGAIKDAVEKKAGTEIVSS